MILLFNIINIVPNINNQLLLDIDLMIKAFTNLSTKFQRQFVKYNFARKKKGGEEKD